MRLHRFAIVLTAALIVGRAGAQSPMTDVFRQNAAFYRKNLISAAETMGADKYSFKPTPAQMSFADIIVHVTHANDLMCASLGAVAAPTRPALAASDAKDVLLAQLRDSFAFCERAIAKMDDTKMDEQLPFFGGRTASRASIMMDAATDWADHYSQFAIYLRLVGLTPPTAAVKER